MSRLPPYAKRTKPDKSQTLHILTGSEAWDRARSTTWFPDKKVILPFGESPSTYDWSFSTGWADAVIWCFGEPESQESVTSLAVELLQRRSLVLYVGPKQSTVRFQPSKEAA